MCGFFGAITKNINYEKAEFALEKMGHRGPDETDFYLNDKVYLGHNRLVVVDKVNGKQPYVFNELVMIYNGELYNTDKLRKMLLQRGYTFFGHSDTEVLIKMFYEYKEDCVKFLNGIFSFVIFNTQTKKIFACRDRAGVKPLFYYHKNEDFAIASEIKPFLYYFDINTIDIDGIRQILALGPSRQDGSGIYPDVYELKAGHYLTYENGILKTVQYWNVLSEPFTKSFDDTVDITKYLVSDSIKGQLVSDVPLCTYLSGGLDSSAITAIASYHKPDLQSYSIDYEDNSKYFAKNDFQVSQDAEFIKLMVDKFKIKHNSIIISNNDLFKNLTNSLILRDYPGMVDIDSSLLWFSRVIKNKFTVALSGECADEIFGGYPWFYRNTNSFGFPWIRNVKERNLLLNDKYKQKLDIENYVLEKYKETLNQTPLSGEETSEEKKHKEMFYLNLKWFMQALLERKDRMTMGASLEVRVPFADHRLIEFLYNVPWDFKYRENTEKYLLRQAVKGILPKEILQRKKNPYPKTHNPEYLKMVSLALSNVLEDKNSIIYEIFDEKVVRQLLKEENKELSLPWFGQLMTQPQLIAYLYQFHKWFELYHLNIK